MGPWLEGCRYSGTGGWVNWTHLHTPAWWMMLTLWSLDSGSSQASGSTPFPSLCGFPCSVETSRGLDIFIVAVPSQHSGNVPFKVWELHYPPWQSFKYHTILCTMVFNYKQPTNFSRRREPDPTSWHSAGQNSRRKCRTGCRVTVIFEKSSQGLVQLMINKEEIIWSIAHYSS